MTVGNHCLSQKPPNLDRKQMIFDGHSASSTGEKLGLFAICSRITSKGEFSLEFMKGKSDNECCRDYCRYQVERPLGILLAECNLMAWSWKEIWHETRVVREWSHPSRDYLDRINVVIQKPEARKTMLELKGQVLYQSHASLVNLDVPLWPPEDSVIVYMSFSPYSDSRFYPIIWALAISSQQPQM